MVGIQTTSTGWVVVLVLTYRLSFPSLVAQMVRNLSAMQETQVRSMGGEDALEKETATRYSCLGKPHRQRSLEAYRPWGHKELDMTEHIKLITHRYIMITKVLSFVSDFFNFCLSSVFCSRIPSRI